MLEQRNMMAHTYNEERADKAAQLLREAYYPAMREFQAMFSSLAKQ